MERIVSTEERIRRAEEIYARRQGNKKQVATVNVGNGKRKEIKLLKKMFIQVLVCLLIYIVIYAIVNNEYIFSEDFRNKLNEILSYDTNFVEIYENAKNLLGLSSGQNQDNQTPENEQENSEGGQQNDEAVNGETGSTEDAIGGADLDSIALVDEPKELTEEEQKIETIKNTASFIKPIEGTITSEFGQRESTSANIPKNHTGTDIAANLGTKIKAATDGEVVLVSEEGDYGKHIKVQIGEVGIVYAHCNAIYVNQGDKIVQGQEIAEVGSTGNSTGPHLHFEVRLSEQPVNPQKILDL